MSRPSKIHYFDDEGRHHLAQTVKHVKTYLKALVGHGEPHPKKIIFLTNRGEGPAIAYNELHSYDVQIIAVTFPPRSIKTTEDGFVEVQIPEKIKRFFDGVGIKVITSRLPFDSLSNAKGANDDLKLIQDCLNIFGSSMSLAIQCVLQACDHGVVEIGEKVIAVTGDSAVIATASTSALFLDVDRGLVIHEIICKPRERTVGKSSKPVPSAPIIDRTIAPSPSVALENTRHFRDLDE